MNLWFHNIKAALTGKNSQSTPPEVIKDQMLEPRPLPLGAEEFEIWSDRIISGSLLPADPKSMKFSLANMIMHLGPTESHKPDAYFIHSLLKAASNQVAHAHISIVQAEEKAKRALVAEAAVLEAQAKSEAAALATLARAEATSAAGYEVKKAEVEAKV